MSERRLRVALLGAGGRGRAVIRNWVQETGCEVSAVVDPSPASLEATKAALGPAGADTEYVTDIEGWLARADVDIVSINSWDTHHARNAIQCFEAGLNIQVAKPMTQTTNDADAVYAAWRRSGRIGVVDMQVRTSELSRKAMEYIHGGMLGNVRLINCFDYVGRSGVEFRHARSRRRDSIRSWTLAKGVHFLDMLNMFMGSDPTRVYASGGLDVFGGDKPDDLHCDVCDERRDCLYEGSRILIGGMPYPNPRSGCVYSREMDVTDNCVAVIDYAGGGRASYTECYFTPEYQTTYEIVGDRGTLFVRYSMDERLHLQYRALGTAKVEYVPIYTSGAHGGGDRNIILAIAAAIRQGCQIHPDIRDGRMAVALAEAIDQSIVARQPIAIPPLPDVQPAKPAAAARSGKA